MKRNSKIEILREVSMFMVLLLHSNLHGGALSYYQYGSFGFYLFWLIESVCMVAVNVFVFITGYYGTQSKFKLSRIIRFYLEVLCFSIICTFISAFFLSGDVAIIDWIYAIFPLSSKRYWFASNYALFLFIQPFLNELIRGMDNNKYKQLVIVLIFLFSLIPTFLIWSRELVGTGMDIIWFVVLYLVGAFIHCYESTIKKRKWFSLYIFLFLILFIMNVFIPELAYAILGTPRGLGIFNYYNSIFVFCESVCFFMAFVHAEGFQLEQKIDRLELLSKFGKYAFGAYLISDHRVIRSALWSALDITSISENVAVVLIYIIVVNFFIYFLGVFLDWTIKKFLANVPVEKLVEKIAPFARRINIKFMNCLFG